MTLVPAPVRVPIDQTVQAWELLLIGAGPRPVKQTTELLQQLQKGPWAAAAGTDSDGDWDDVDIADQWRCWYQAARPSCEDWFVVEALDPPGTIFSIHGTNALVVSIVAEFFRGYCGGTLRADAGMSAGLRAAARPAL